MDLRKCVALIAVGLSAALTTTCSTAQSGKVSISCGAVGKELEFCKAGAEAWAKKTGKAVNIVSTPDSATERLALYQQLLAAGAADIDVFQIDVVWPGILASHFIDLSEAAGKTVEEHFPAIVKNNTVRGKLVGMPWFTDAGVLYYRKDLLQTYHANPPSTWEELTSTARTIQDGERKGGNDKMWGYVWQGRAYEGLTCNALEWIASYNGGTVVDASGKVTIDNPGAAAALKTAAGWVDTITPKGVLNYGEEEARGVFQSGNAVFMRNWPYAWNLANNADSPIKDKVGVIALPKGGADGRHAGTLGGWQLAVSKYSKNQKEATDLVLYLTSTAEQKRRAIEGSYNPTIVSLYKDKEVLAAVPFFGDLYETFVNAVPRPSTPTGNKYNQVSSEFFNAASAVLSGRAEPAAALRMIDEELGRMSRGGEW
jgi:trehalose/maltose transport system substrate-binding protein